MLKYAIFDELQKNELVKTDKSGQRKKPVDEPAKPNYIDVEVDDTHIRVHKYWRPAFIAVFVLSKIFLILGLYFYFKASSLEKEMAQFKAATQQTAPAATGKTP